MYALKEIHKNSEGEVNKFRDSTSASRKPANNNGCYSQPKNVRRPSTIIRKR